MLRRTRKNDAAILVGCAILLSTFGCRLTGRNTGAGGLFGDGSDVRHVICLYDRRPWLSADAEGDRDPEGLRFRVFLDKGNNRGAYSDGTFHIDMYGISRDENGKKKRTLVSDWHYPTSTFTRVRAKIMGDGYVISLRWASKEIAGTDIEIVTTFEDVAGRKTQASTRRLRVPNYDDYLGLAD